MPVSLYLLAREWRFDSVEPGPDAMGYWSGDIGTLDLRGLLTIPGMSPPAFWLDEASDRALLRPNTPADEVRDVDQPAFYFEVVAVSTQHLQLALWLWHAPVSKHQHTLTFAWVSLDSTPISENASLRQPPSTTAMLLGFDPAFVPPIQAGTKIHTIRRGHRWQAGQLIRFCLNTDQATGQTFRPDAPVTSTQHLRILDGRHLFIDERPIRGAELEQLAHHDGFLNAKALLNWFQDHYGPVFEGQLIHWTPARY